MTGPVATRMVLSDPSVDVAVLEIARGGLLRAGMGVRTLRRRRGAQREGRPSGPPRHRHAGTAGRGEADRGRGGPGDGDPQRRRPALPQDGRLHRGQAPVLRHHGPHPRAGGRAHQGGRTRRGAGDRDQGSDDHDLRSRRPYPAALDPPDPGHAGRPGHAQRAERDVRGGHGVQHGTQAGRHPARAPHLRHHVLPGARAG